MATLSNVPVIDYQNSTQAGLTGSLASNGTTGVLTVGKRRALLITAHISNSASIVDLNITAGLSTGTTAPAPTSASPFFIASSGVFVMDTGDLYDQIQLGNFLNGATTVLYSVVVLSKY